MSCGVVPVWPAQMNDTYGSMLLWPTKLQIVPEFNREVMSDVHSHRSIDKARSIDSAHPCRLISRNKKQNECIRVKHWNSFAGPFFFPLAASTDDARYCFWVSLDSGHTDPSQNLSPPISSHSNEIDFPSSPRQHGSAAGCTLHPGSRASSAHTHKQQ